jgi:uncharacterized protein (DUF427 family)
LDSNDYSVHPSVIGRRVKVTADADHVQVCCDGHVVADHRRCWAIHQTITDPAHASAAAGLRASYRTKTATPVITEVAQPELSDYDRVFGVDIDGQAA